MILILVFENYQIIDAGNQICQSCGVTNSVGLLSKMRFNASSHVPPLITNMEQSYNGYNAASFQLLYEMTMINLLCVALSQKHLVGHETNDQCNVGA